MEVQKGFQNAVRPTCVLTLLLGVPTWVMFALSLGLLPKGVFGIGVHVFFAGVFSNFALPVVFVVGLVITLRLLRMPESRLRKDLLQWSLTGNIVAALTIVAYLIMRFFLWPL